jgi:signal transduction histidine kinase
VRHLWTGWDRPWRDVVLAGAFAACWFGGMAWALGNGWFPESPESYVLAGLGVTLALACGWSWPLATFVLMVVGYPALVLRLVWTEPSGSEFLLLPLFLVAYQVAASGRLRTLWTLPACWLAVVVSLRAGYRVLNAFRPDGPAQDWLMYVWFRSFSQFLFQLVLITSCVLLGRAQFRQRRAADLLEARNAELERLRGVEARQVITAERTRIARELHDVVAHHVSAIVIRAQAADRVADGRPDEPREAVRWIATTGQEALAAMRHVVRVLRTGEPGTGLGGPPTTGSLPVTPAAASAGSPATAPLAVAPLAPHATLAELPDLAARVSGAGVPVDLDVAPLPPLPPQVELAALRIVQESLTNVLLHAGATRAAVRVAPEGGSLRVDVDDDGPAGPPSRDPFAPGAPAPTASGGGNGLPGMRERALSCGGHVGAGASPLGGWRVTALLPAAPAAPVAPVVAGTRAVPASPTASTVPVPTSRVVKA